MSSDQVLSIKLSSFFHLVKSCSLCRSDDNLPCAQILVFIEVNWKAPTWTCHHQINIQRLTNIACPGKKVDMGPNIDDSELDPLIGIQRLKREPNIDNMFNPVICPPCWKLFIEMHCGSCLGHSGLKWGIPNLALNPILMVLVSSLLEGRSVRSP